jgi:hypothetical protein
MVSVCNSFGDSSELFAWAAAVSQSVRRDINSLMSVCRYRRPDADVWNLAKIEIGFVNLSAQFFEFLFSLTADGLRTATVSFVQRSISSRRIFPNLLYCYHHRLGFFDEWMSYSLRAYHESRRARQTCARRCQGDSTGWPERCLCWEWRSPCGVGWARTKTK